MLPLAAATAVQNGDLAVPAPAATSAPAKKPEEPLRDSAAGPKFQVDENLERQADAARIAMGDAYLCAVPIRKRLVLDNPDTFVRPPAIEEGELPIG